MMAVMALGGATSTILRINAWIRPACSARPTPIMATRMIPTGPKLMKFGTTDVKMKRIPSADSRLLTAVVVVFGLVGQRIDPLIGDAGSQQMKNMGEQDDHANQHGKKARPDAGPCCPPVPPRPAVSAATVFGATLV